METLQQLASGTIPPVFPFAFASEFDPSSPWSLCLAFFPESCSLSALSAHLSEQSLSHVEKLDPETAEFVQNRCTRLGWCASSVSTTALDLFLQVRLRQTDEFCRQMDLPSSLRVHENEWVDGTVRVLQLWRRLASKHGNDGGIAHLMTLSEFEAEDPERIYVHLASVKPPRWDLRQRLEFLLMPYLRFVNRTDLVQNMVNECELMELICAVNIKELTAPVFGRCLLAPAKDWPIVQQIAETVSVHASSSDSISSGDSVSSTEPQSSEITKLLVPTVWSIQLWKDLVATAQLGKFPTTSFRQLAEWAMGSVQLQSDLFTRFLNANPHFTVHDLTVLRKTLVKQVPESVVSQQCLRACLRTSRFMFIQHHLRSPELSLVLAEEVKQLVSEFERNPSAADLAKQVAALELVQTVGDPQIDLLREKMSRLNAVYKTFGLEPEFVLKHQPLENVTKALESGNQAYRRYTDLANLAGGGDRACSQVAERCVETALADDNFEVVLEFFDRGLIKPQHSETAWMAFYQAGKYVSPNWDLPRPAKYREKQAKLLSEALLVCDSRDLPTVLNAWSNIDTEKPSKPRSVAPTPPPSSQSAASSSPLSPAVSSGSRGAAIAHFDADKARDQISSIFKSGIGWVVGANPPP